jgi:hypothetical protein
MMKSRQNIHQAFFVVEIGIKCFGLCVGEHEVDDALMKLRTENSYQARLRARGC